MIQRILSLAHKEIRGMHQAAYILATLTFGAQLLALVRDRLLAHTFGLGHQLDVYYTAFRIPDLLFVLFASALSAYVLIPFVAERSIDGTIDRARAFLSQIFTLFCAVYAVLAVVVAIVLPYITPHLFPGFAPEQQVQIVTLTRILLIQPFFLGISGILAVVTQLRHRFILYALSPLLYNLGIILGILVFYGTFGLKGLAFGVVAGAMLHAAVQIPSIMTSGLLPRFTTEYDWRALRAVLIESLPRAITLSLQQVVLFVFVGMASLIAAGSVAALQFAYNLQSVPLAIIGVSYSVAAFPLLAKKFAEGDMFTFRAEIGAGMRHVLFWTVPVIVLCIVLRAQVVRVVFGTGAFDWDATRLTAAVFALFAVSLLAQSLHVLLVRAWYAAGNTRVPLLVTTAMSGGIIMLGYGAVRYFESIRVLLETLLRVRDVPGTTLLALPFAYSTGMLLGVAVLAVCTIRKFSLPWIDFVQSLARALVASSIGGSVTYVGLGAFAGVFGTQTTLGGIFMQGLCAGIVGILATGVAYAGMRSPELKEIVNAIRRRMVAPQPALTVDDAPRD